LLRNAAYCSIGKSTMRPGVSLMVNIREKIAAPGSGEIRKADSLRHRFGPVRDVDSCMLGALISKLHP
jgi:hypothetical protein